MLTVLIYVMSRKVYVRRRFRAGHKRIAVSSRVQVDDLRVDELMRSISPFLLSEGNDTR